MPLSDLWKRKTPEELLRQNQRALNRTIRELERERGKLERQEKKIITDIKKMAKTGQMRRDPGTEARVNADDESKICCFICEESFSREAVRIMAKDLVRTRNHVKKFYLMKANIQAISLKLQTLRSQAAMAKAMKGVSKAMARMNSQLKLPELQKIMMDFERESEIMDLKEELIGDTIDDAIGDEDEDEESEALVQKVFDELGLEYTDELSGVVPSKGLPEQQKGLGATSDLEARLANLKST